MKLKALKEKRNNLISFIPRYLAPTKHIVALATTPLLKLFINEYLPLIKHMVALATIPSINTIDNY
jgi:hypothetical protein